MLNIKPRKGGKTIPIKFPSKKFVLLYIEFFWLKGEQEELQDE